MGKRLSAFVILFILSGCTSGGEMELPSKVEVSEVAEPFAASDQIEEEAIPSVIVEINGEEIILVDMEDPIVRSFYEDCGFDVSSINVVITEERIDRSKTPVEYYSAEVTGNFDQRYIYPKFEFTVRPLKAEHLEMIEALGSGASLLDYVQQSGWGGIVFDETGFPVAFRDFNEESGHTVGYSSTVLSHMSNNDANRALAFRSFFEWGDPLIMTDAIRNGLVERGFDLENTRAMRGSGNGFQYIFTDGVNEIMLTSEYTIELDDPVWKSDLFLTAQDVAEYLSDWYTPKPVYEEQFMDSLRKNSDPADEIWISNGSAYKIVSEHDFERCYNLLVNYGVLYNRQYFVEFEAEYVIFAGEFYYEFGTVDGEYYYHPNFSRLYKAERSWGEAICALYDSLDSEELPVEEFNELVEARDLNPFSG